MKTPTVVVIDQEHENLELIKTVLDSARYNVRAFANPLVALQYMEQHSPDVLLTDLQMPELDGFKLLAIVQRQWPHCQVIIFAAYGGVVDAVRAIKAGAADFLTKPLNREAIPAMVGQLLELQSKTTAAAQPFQALPPQAGKAVPPDKALPSVVSLANTVAGTDCAVLITGETGTGKEVLADYIWANSARRDRPCVKVDCAAIPETLVESELFGHEAGAFPGAHRQRIGRFERAHQGTLFLDEIGNLSENMQGKLLRVLQTHEIERLGGAGPVKIDFRLICATRYELAELLAGGKFRQELYYRINTFPIHIPPLRERREEIADFARHFLARSQKALGRGPATLAPEALELLQAYSWPGNVRELEHCLERASLLAREPLLQKSDLWWLDVPLPAQSAAALPAATGYLLAAASGELNVPLPGLSPLENAERTALKQTLEQYNWSFTRAAAALGISRSTLYLKTRKYALARQRSPAADSQ